MRLAKQTSNCFDVLTSRSLTMCTRNMRLAKQTSNCSSAATNTSYHNTPHHIHIIIHFTTNTSHHTTSDSQSHLGVRSLAWCTRNLRLVKWTANCRSTVTNTSHLNTPHLITPHKTTNLTWEREVWCCAPGTWDVKWTANCRSTVTNTSHHNTPHHITPHKTTNLTWEREVWRCAPGTWDWWSEQQTAGAQSVRCTRWRCWAGGAPLTGSSEAVRMKERTVLTLAVCHYETFFP